jgi:hypothetical protein
VCNFFCWGVWFFLDWFLPSKNWVLSLSSICRLVVACTEVCACFLEANDGSTTKTMNEGRNEGMSKVVQILEIASQLKALHFGFAVGFFPFL